jgi:hypothetical protein
MKNILLYLAIFGCIASLSWASQRKLDSTLLVTKKGLTVESGTAPVIFKCGQEWSIAFTKNGGTATLSTIKGHWTLTGLSSAVAVAAINEGATLVSAIASSVGVPANQLSAVTKTTLNIASALASTIGKPGFDSALITAVNKANALLDSAGIKASDFNADILALTKLLGPSGTVISAAGTTVADVEKNAQKVIGYILNALSSMSAYTH